MIQLEFGELNCSAFDLFQSRSLCYDFYKEKNLYIYLGERMNENPETLAIEQEELNRLLEFLKTELTAQQAEIVNLRLEGKTYLQIGEHFKKSDSWAENAMSRIRNKYNASKKKR